MNRLLQAAHFAARKHSTQRRKNAEASPYINHPIEVAFHLSAVGKVEDEDILIAALLHDTIEDTETSEKEICAEFGGRVASLVSECTDDKSLPKLERKRLQIENAPKKSAGAKIIKIADKTCNLRALLSDPQADWDLNRQHEYFLWAEKVVAGLLGENVALDVEVQKVLQEGIHKIGIGIGPPRTMPAVQQFPALKPACEAFAACRQFSRDRLGVLAGIRAAREMWMDKETVRLSAFSRLQIGNTHKSCEDIHYWATGSWEGRPVAFYTVVRPLFIRYAVEVFKQALAETLARYPEFTRVEIVDGPLTGQWRVTFPDRLDDTATNWLHARFCEIAERGDIRVSESCSWTLACHGGIPPDHDEFELEVELDLPETDSETALEITQALVAGRLPEIDPNPRRCDRKLTLEMLQHVSLPELFVLNFEECTPSLTLTDIGLFIACKSLDISRIRQALSKGAEPNRFRWPNNPTPLGNVIGALEYVEPLTHRASETEQKALEAIDLLIAAGAAIDLAAFNEHTPLAAACEAASPAIIAHLLKHGADPTILCYDHEPQGSWGTAWDSARFRADAKFGNDPCAWNTLTEFYPPPDERVCLERAESIATHDFGGPTDRKYFETLCGTYTNGEDTKPITEFGLVRRIGGVTFLDKSGGKWRAATNAFYMIANMAALFEVPAFDGMMSGSEYWLWMAKPEPDGGIIFGGREFAHHGRLVRQYFCGDLPDLPCPQVLGTFDEKYVEGRTNLFHYSGLLLPGQGAANEAYITTSCSPEGIKKILGPLKRFCEEVGVYPSYVQHTARGEEKSERVPFVW